MTAEKISSSAGRQLVSEMVETARAAQKELAVSSYDTRCNALVAAAGLLRANKANILHANEADILAATEKGTSSAFIDRLTLTEQRIEAMAAGLEAIASLDDPLGATLAQWTRPNGLDISRISTPLGVIGVIYESRPNVTIDAGGLCLMSGNAAILRGGSDSHQTSKMLAELMSEGLVSAGLSGGAVQIVPTADRTIVGAMLTATGEIDVIIPRGGKSLVERVQTEARFPVFAHLEGICHVYVSANADPEKACAIVVNAKMRRTGICGAAETLLIDKAVASTILPEIAGQLREAGCSLRGDEAARSIFTAMDVAREDDWRTEYLDSIISVKVVDGLDAAIAHIDL